MSFYNLKLNKEMNNLHACISSNQNDPKEKLKRLRRLKKGK